MSVATRAPGEALLLCEALKFSPQLLLDDIINIANNAVQDGVNGMEEFLLHWGDTRTANDSEQAFDMDAMNKEAEQGLVAFQTLLEYHTDIAFDFFEAWSLRNIFHVPSSLPIVLPHGAGLVQDDTTHSEAREFELMDQLESLRNELQTHRHMHRLLQRAVKKSVHDLDQARKRTVVLAPLTPDFFHPLAEMPAQFAQLTANVQALPPIPAPPHARAMVAPRKREWEEGPAGYARWAAGRMLERVEEGRDVLGALERTAQGMGEVEDMNALVEAWGKARD